MKDAPGIKWAALFGLFISLTGSDLYASDAPVTIRISTQNSNQSNITLIHFKEHVEAESKGGIHVAIFDSAKLYGDSEIIDAVSSGAVEIGWVTLPRYAAVIPAVDVFQLPFLFNTEAIAAAARAPQSEIRQLIEDAILVQRKSRVLWWVSQGPLVFLSNGVSVADPRNLAGKTVRTFGPAMAAVVRECGGEPKDIGGPAQEKAYETHTVDMGMTGIPIVMERKLWRFMNVVTRTNHASLESLVVMNEAFWQRLSEDHKEIIAAASRAANKEAADLLLKVETAAYAELADRGVQIVDLSTDELTAWRICSSDVISNFVEKSHDLRQKLMTAYGRLRQQPCCNQGGGNSAPKY